MKYTIQSTKYVCKNFFYLFPLVILPALFLSISTDQKAIYSVLAAIGKGNIQDWTFTNLFRAISVLNFGSWQSIVFGLVGIIAIVPCVALLMAMLEKHMRIGKRTFNGLWGKLNDNFLSTCGYFVLILAIYEVWTLLLTSILFLVSRIPLAALSYTFSTIIFLAFHVLLLVVISVFYLWLPCAQITGFRAYEALQYSYHLMGEIKAKIIAVQASILLVVEGLICLCAMLLPTGIVFNLFVAAFYVAVLLIYCVRMQIVYFDRDHIEREDLPKIYR